MSVVLPVIVQSSPKCYRRSQRLQMFLQKTTTMNAFIGIYVVVTAISILEVSASTYDSFASSRSSFAPQPQWPPVQPPTQRRSDLFQLPAQNWASTGYQQPTFQTKLYNNLGSASSAYQNTPSPYIQQNTYSLPLSSGGSYNQDRDYSAQNSYLSSNYPLAHKNQGSAINQQRMASASNAGSTSSTAGFPNLDGISNSLNSYLPYKDPLKYASIDPALFKQESASIVEATSSAVADSSIQNRLNTGENIYFYNTPKYGNYGLGITQQGTSAVSTSVAATSNSYPVQPSSQPSGMLNSDEPSNIKLISVPLPSQRIQTLHLPINIKDSHLKVIHRNADNSNSHSSISNDALEYLSKINTDYRQIESNPQSFIETNYSSRPIRQQSTSQSEAQATSNSGSGNLSTGNIALYEKRDDTQQGINVNSDAQAALSIATISDSHPVQPPSSQAYDNLNNDELSKIKSSLPSSLQSLGLPFNIKDAHLRVIHRNPFAADGFKAQGGVSSDALQYLTSISSKFEQIESNPESFSETDYPSQPITQQSTSQSKAKSTSNSGFENLGTENNSNYGKRDAGTTLNRYPQGYGLSYTQQGATNVEATLNTADGTQQGIADASDAEATSSVTAGSSNQDVKYSYPQELDPGYTQRSGATHALATSSTAAGSSTQGSPYSYLKRYRPDYTQQGMAGASDVQATSSAAAGSSNQGATYSYSKGYGPNYNQEDIASASSALATSSAAAGSSNQDGSKSYPQGYGPSYTQHGIAGASNIQTTSSAAAGSSNQDALYSYPQYIHSYTQQGKASASDAQATSITAADTLNQDGTVKYPHGYGLNYNQQGASDVNDAQVKSSAAAGSSNEDIPYSYPQRYGPGYTQQGIVGASDVQATSSAAAGWSTEDTPYSYIQGYVPSYSQQGIADVSVAQTISSAAAGSSNQDAKYSYPQKPDSSYTQQGDASDDQVTSSTAAGSSIQDAPYSYPRGYSPDYNQQGASIVSDAQATSSAAADSSNQDAIYSLSKGYGPGYTQQESGDKSHSQATTSAVAAFSDQGTTYSYPQGHGSVYTQQEGSVVSDAQATSSAADGSSNQDGMYSYPQGHSPAYTQQGIADASNAQAISSAAADYQDRSNSYSQGYDNSGPGLARQGANVASDVKTSSSATDDSYNTGYRNQPIYQEASSASNTQVSSSSLSASDQYEKSKNAPESSLLNNRKRYYGRKESTASTSSTSASSVSQSKASTKTTSGNQGVVLHDGKPNTVNQQNFDERDLDNNTEIPINSSNLEDTPDVITNSGKYTPIKDNTNNTKNKLRDQDESLNSDELSLDKDSKSYGDQSEIPYFKEKETDYGTNWPNIDVYNRKRNYNKENNRLDDPNNSPKRKESYNTIESLQTYENNPINLYAYTTLAPTDIQSTRYYQPHLSNQYHIVPNQDNKKPYPGNFPNYSQATATSSFTSPQDYEQGSTPLYVLSEDGWGGLTTNSPFSNDDGMDRNIYSKGSIRPTLNSYDFSIPNEEASGPLYHLPNFKQKPVVHRNKNKPNPSDSQIYPYYYSSYDVTETPYPTTWAPQNDRNKNTDNQLNVFGTANAEADATSFVKSQNTAIHILASKYPNIESATYYPKGIQSSTVYYSTQGYPTTEYPFENVSTKDYSLRDSTELYSSNTGGPNYRSPTKKYNYNKRIPNTTPNFTNQDKKYDPETGFVTSVTNSLPSLTSQKTTDPEDLNATESPPKVPAGSNTKKTGVSASSFFKALLSEVGKKKPSKTSTKKCGECNGDNVPSGKPDDITSSEELAEQTNDTGSKPAVSKLFKLFDKLFG